MRYLLLCCVEETLQNAMPKSEYDVVIDRTLAYLDELRDSGQLVAAEKLESVRTATTVRVRGGKLATTDGPFAETKEQLGGFFLIDARDLNEAISLASKFPAACLGSIEVRRVMELPRPATTPGARE